MTAKKKYADYESAMNRLQEITEALESGDTKLEQAIDLYTEGLEIARFCEQKLGEAEQKIKVILDKNGVLEEADFAPGEKE
ncbi:MAG: exodeoxyribonuclease VII small subunit [Candidatus Zixiibacteriota bacterium]